jgi:Domain of unknown function (DUF4186)
MSNDVRLDDVFARLAGSTFRRRFRLGGGDLDYLRRRGMDAVLGHAHELIRARLAPAQPPNDGKQTPMRGHPVFVAQHATATCCRGCLARWHGIAKGHELTEDERAYVVSVIARWLAAQDREAPPSPPSVPPASDEEQLGLGME